MDAQAIVGTAFVRLVLTILLHNRATCTDLDNQILYIAPGTCPG